MKEQLQNLKILLEKATPGPWRVEYSVNEHSAGSTNCVDYCGQGKEPLSVRTTSEGLVLHKIPCDQVDDIISADETHVFCTGHDYDEPRHVEAKNAELTVSAVNALPALLEEREKLIGALREISEGRGRFSLDHHEHAKNTIEDMKALALAALGEGRQVG